MKIKSVKANVINAYIKSHANARQGEWPIEIAGEIRKEPYYKLPIEYLKYSVENGRFAAEKLALEAELNRTLDPEDDSDVNEIRKMLLETDPEATLKLRNDLIDKGQLQPGVITADGYVKNGNRRLAILEELHKEKPSGKFQFLNVIILPESVSEADLWRIEAGLQLSQDTKLNYGPINELLKLKEGKEAGLSEGAMASAMYGWTEEKVKEALERLVLMEQYLEFWGRPKQYKKAENTHEYFIDLQKNIKKWVNECIDNIELEERIKVAFCYIENVNTPGRKTSHKDIRMMYQVFESPKAGGVLLKSISDKTHKRYENDPEASSDFLAYMGFKDAREIVENEKERNHPRVLLSKAIRSLEEIVNVIDSTENFKNEENIELLKRIKKLVLEALEKIGINGTESTSRN